MKAVKITFNAGMTENGELSVEALSLATFKINNIVKIMHRNSNILPFAIALPKMIRKKTENDVFVSIGNEIIIYCEDEHLDSVLKNLRIRKNQKNVEIRESEELIGYKTSAFVSTNINNKFTVANIKYIIKKYKQGKLDLEKMIEKNRIVDYAIIKAYKQYGNNIDKIFKFIKKYKSDYFVPFLKIESLTSLKKGDNPYPYKKIGVLGIAGENKFDGNDINFETKSYCLSQIKQKIFLPVF